MKIEIGESLAQSWLKHVHGCQVVQLNWKASNQNLLEHELALAVYKEAVGLTGDAESRFFTMSGKEGRDPRKAFKQFLGQAEVDAFGVKISAGAGTGSPAAELFAVDVAFHANGLGYKDNNLKVAMKMVRSALALLTGFGVRSGRVIFASPNVRDSEQKILEDTFTNISALFERHNLLYQFDLITNDTFESTLLIPTIEKTRGQTDMAELFLRSVRMLERFPKALNTVTATAAQHAIRLKSAKAVPADVFETMSVAQVWDLVQVVPTKDNELKIGAALYIIMQKLDKDDAGLVGLRKVLDKGHKLSMSKELTVFREFSTPTEQADRRLDALGRSRYYSTPLAEHKLLFSSQWNYKGHHAEWPRLLNDAGLH